MLLSGLLDEAQSNPGGQDVFLQSGLAEALFAFGIVLPLLFVPQLGAVAPATSFAITLIYGGMRWRHAAAKIARCWPLLLIPAYALLSVLWSDYPAITLKHTIQLTITVLGGLLLSASIAPAGVLAGVWAAFGVFMIVSLALGQSVGMGSMVGAGAEGTAFAGLNGMKNLFGMTAAIATLTSMFMLSRAVARRAWLLSAAVFCLLLAEVYLVYASRSAGAILAVAVSVAAFLVMIILGGLRPAARVIAGGLIASVGALILAIGLASANSIAAIALNVFQKDPTLTGRSYLWYRAADYIQERPLLGRGFEAFWVQGNIDAEGLWQYGRVAGRSGFNFHNTLIEMLMHYGWLGAILMLAVFAMAAIQLLWRGLKRPDAASAFYVAVVTLTAARSPFESLMPSPVDFATVLMFAALGYGFGRPAPAAAPHIYVRRSIQSPRLIPG